MMATWEEVLAGQRMWSCQHGEAVEFLSKLPDQSVDLSFGSPPYEDARTYGIGVKRKGQDWVDWMVEVIRQCLRVTKGMVAFVVEGRTKQFQWTATPALLMADLHRAGVCLRKPVIYHRRGIPGGGGRSDKHAAAGGSADDLVNAYEFVIRCTSKRGPLPWADTLATGRPPVFDPGGAMSYRMVDGERVNAKKSSRGHDADGVPQTLPGYKSPKIANPGNIVECPLEDEDAAELAQIVHCKVGKGNMGDELCHKSHAPFPEKLAEFHVRSFCPEHGIVLDPFTGSGTTTKICSKWHRRFVGCDLDPSMLEVVRDRMQKFECMFHQAAFDKEREKVSA